MNLPAASMWIGALSFCFGCAFGEADATVDNTCGMDADCGAESRCIEGVCVAEGSTELTFSLEVTPTHMPDGSPPFPMSLGPFVLDGRSRNFELPIPIAVEGRIFDRDKTGAVIPIAASLHFAPMNTPQGRVTRTLSASTTEGSDLATQLLRGVKYRVTIEPVDTTMPPYALEFVAEEGERLDVDYSTVKWAVQKFQVEGLEDGRKLTLRALDDETGEPISSTGQTGDGPVVLASSCRRARVTCRRRAQHHRPTKRHRTSATSPRRSSRC
jgi:hypothetical protein